MVAGDIGEGAGGEIDAVDAPLLEPMARRLKRKMGDAGCGKLGENRVQLDRVRRRVGEHLRAGWANHADGAEACGAMALKLPKLACEGGDRSLAVGTGDRHGDLGLRSEEARRDERKPAARIGVFENRRSIESVASALRHEHRRGPALQGIGDEAGAVGARPRKRRKQIAGLDGAAVGRKPEDRNLPPPRGGFGPHQLAKGHGF